MKWEDFNRWFNRDFWRAFKNRTFPIRIPLTAAEKEVTVCKVFEAVKSARYAPSIPEAEIVMNKGHGVARTIPVFCIEDYIVFYFCIKELEEVISGNRTDHTFGGWTLGGRLRKLEDIDVEFDSGFSNARYAFDPRAWTAAFGEFNSLLFAQLETGAYTHVLQFDLSNFYDCVRLDILERWIREDAPANKGWVIAHTTDGRKLERVEMHNRGSAGNPMCADDVRGKFRENAARTLDAKAIDAVIGIVDRLEREPAISAVIDLCIR
jgi:hypothetical protein